MKLSQMLSQVVIASLLLTTTSSLVTSARAADRYKRSDIANARFGEGERKQLLEKSYKLASSINKKIVGQEQASAALQERVVNYLESFGTRTSDPISMNLIGLPGIGKTAMLTELQKAGFPIAHFDAQKYSASNTRASFASELATKVEKAINDKTPLILVVEEIDKVPELSPNGGQETTSELIGVLNQILSDGRFSNYANTYDMSNIMVLTTMNFAPTEMEAFTGTVLKEEKSFYDLTLDDMVKFDQWIRTQQSARYKILSRLFRSNTVSRLAPNTIIMKPLTEDSYRKIAEIIARRSIEKNTTGANAGKRVSVEIDPSLIEFLVKETVYPPSGARETVFRADALVEQLINFGLKAKAEKNDSPDRPRKLLLSVDLVHHEALIKVTNRVLSNQVLQDRESFEFRVKFDEGARLFEAPTDILRIEKPIYDTKAAAAKPFAVTQKVIVDARFPKAQKQVEGLAQDIGKTLLGQEEALKIAEADLNKYLGRQGPAKKEPSFRVLSGFPGIGKSELVKLVAERTGLSIARVNMQQFSSDSPASVKQFFDTVEKVVGEIKAKRPDGKYILLIEELDKVFEIAPDGRLMNRPIMAVIKDLMNDGISTITESGDFGVAKTRTIDARGAMTFATMNFSVDRFHFKADPRLTTIDDVMNAWRSLKMTPMAIKEVLGSMFLPETVSRLMARFTIMKPLAKNEYQALINRQTEIVTKARLIDDKGINRGQINLKLTPAYRSYLYSETVIPSEGARNTVMGAQARIASDLERALESIPKSSRLGRVPLVVTLDFREGSSTVVARAQRVENGQPVAAEKPKVISQYRVALNFPPLNVKGQVSAERMKTSAHEFGHAFVAARLGIRFGDIVVVPPSPGTGGYVTVRSGRTGVELMSRIYAILASRAFERMVMSEDPRSADSVLRITSGPSRDIQMATKELYNMLFELGMNPNGGTIDRNLIDGPAKYAAIQEMKPETAEKLGLVLRDMENIVLDDLLKSHSTEWYVEKIATVARAGAMTEAEFYSAIGRILPESKANFGSPSKVQAMFKGFVKDRDAAEAAARKATYGE
jgi:ATP-dependent Clp protease ATP-binding subunit ClpA